MADKWKCFFCNLRNEPNTTTCSECAKANVDVVNINQICLCGRKVTKYRYDWNQCHSCCKRREKKEKGYYDCKAKQCIFKKMRGTEFTVCSACYESKNSSTIDSNHSFLFTKVASLVEQIRKETNECQNSDERRR
eukprot:160629_1